jgi:hypothetical protein
MAFCREGWIIQSQYYLGRGGSGGKGYSDYKYDDVQRQSVYSTGSQAKKMLLTQLCFLMKLPLSRAAPFVPAPVPSIELGTGNCWCGNDGENGSGDYLAALSERRRLYNGEIGPKRL